MDGSHVEDALENTEMTFEDTRGQSPETGLDIDDEALVQLERRVGCSRLRRRFVSKTDTIPWL